MASATVSTRGRVTIPKEIRERLRIKAGARVEFRVDTDGKLVFAPERLSPSTDYRELKGLLKGAVKAC